MKSIKQGGFNYYIDLLWPPSNDLQLNDIEGDDQLDNQIKNNLGMGSGILEEEVLSPVVFAGFGQERDFKGIDAKSKVVFVRRIRRGELSFKAPVENAINAGAIAVIIINDEPDLATPVIQLEGRVSVPVMLIGQETGEKIIEAIMDGTLSEIKMIPHRGPAYASCRGHIFSCSPCGWCCGSYEIC